MELWVSVRSFFCLLYQHSFEQIWECWRVILSFSDFSLPFSFGNVLFPFFLLVLLLVLLLPKLSCLFVYLGTFLLMVDLLLKMIDHNFICRVLVLIYDLPQVASKLAVPLFNNNMFAVALADVRALADIHWGLWRDGVVDDALYLIQRTYFLQL